MALFAALVAYVAITHAGTGSTVETTVDEELCELDAEVALD